MPCQIQIHAKPALIEAVYQGALTANELGTAANDIVALIRKHDIHLVLADCTALEGGHTVIDLCALADWLAANHSDLFIKEAVVLPALPRRTIMPGSGKRPAATAASSSGSSAIGTAPSNGW